MIYFKESEFHGFYDKLDPELKVRLDFLRLTLDSELFLSNDPAGIGRARGNSWHNYTIHNDVLHAVDGYIPDDITYKEFYHAALRAGFTGIGFYKDWPSGRRGFHLDTRTDRTEGNPALWAARWSHGRNIYDLNFHELINNE